MGVQDQTPQEPHSTRDPESRLLCRSYLPCFNYIFSQWNFSKQLLLMMPYIDRAKFLSGMCWHSSMEVNGATLIYNENLALAFRSNV